MSLRGDPPPSSCQSRRSYTLRTLHNTPKKDPQRGSRRRAVTGIRPYLSSAAASDKVATGPSQDQRVRAGACQGSRCRPRLQRDLLAFAARPQGPQGPPSQPSCWQGSLVTQASPVNQWRFLLLASHTRRRCSQERRRGARGTREPKQRWRRATRRQQASAAGQAAARATRVAPVLSRTAR